MLKIADPALTVNKVVFLIAVFVFSPFNCYAEKTCSVLNDIVGSEFGLKKFVRKNGIHVYKGKLMQESTYEGVPLKVPSFSYDKKEVDSSFLNAIKYYGEESESALLFEKKYRDRERAKKVVEEKLIAKYKTTSIFKLIKETLGGKHNFCKAESDEEIFFMFMSTVVKPLPGSEKTKVFILNDINAIMLYAGEKYPTHFIFEHPNNLDSLIHIVFFEKGDYYRKNVKVHIKD